MSCLACSSRLIWSRCPEPCVSRSKACVTFLWHCLGLLVYSDLPPIEVSSSCLSVCTRACVALCWQCVRVCVSSLIGSAPTKKRSLACAPLHLRRAVPCGAVVCFVCCLSTRGPWRFHSGFPPADRSDGSASAEGSPPAARDPFCVRYRLSFCALWRHVKALLAQAFCFAPSHSNRGCAFLLAYLDFCELFLNSAQNGSWKYRPTEVTSSGDGFGFIRISVLNKEWWVSDVLVSALIDLNTQFPAYYPLILPFHAQNDSLYSGLCIEWLDIKDWFEKGSL